MKIAIFNTTAKTGSTGKIAYGLYENLLKDGHDVRLYYGRGNLGEDDRIKRIDSTFEFKTHALMARITGLHGYYSTSATKKIIRELEEWQPDIVQLYNLHGYYLNINLLLKWLGRSGVKVVYSMLDEFPYLGRCCYSFDCEAYKNGCHGCRINKADYPGTWFFRRGRKFYKDKSETYDNLINVCFAGPEYVISKAKHSGLLNGREFEIVDEYVETDKLFCPKTEYEYYPTKLAGEKRVVILTVTDYSNPRKGGDYFLSLAESLKDQREYLFVFVGIDESISAPNNCIKIPFVRNQNELAEYYSAADLFVCVSLADTMPNTCLEALACGTPVLGFDNTGISYVAEKPYGIFVENKNIDLMRREVLKIGKKTQDAVEKCRKYAVGRYSPGVYYKKMKGIYESGK